jgi:ABC-type dipeptide/oligopeptide/nickel transport system permease component
MTLSTADLVARFKKRMKIGLSIAGVGVVLSLIGYFLPASIQLVPLVAGYLGLYVGVIFVLYSLWHRYMSADAEAADKADKAKLVAAESADPADA